MELAYISFDKGNCRRLRWAQDRRIEEAINACDGVQQEANLLDEQMNVVARVKREPAAMNGFIVVKA